MANEARCETCKHKTSNPDGGHCYMFKNEPTETCQLHTGLPDGFMFGDITELFTLLD